MLRLLHSTWPLAAVTLLLLPPSTAAAQNMCFGEYQTAAPVPTAEERERATLEVERERAVAARKATQAIIPAPTVLKDRSFPVAGEPARRRP